jgi:hypothetical protein
MADVTTNSLCASAVACIYYSVPVQWTVYVLSDVRLQFHNVAACESASVRTPQGWGRWSPASVLGKSGSFPGPVLYGLWWTKYGWGSSFSQYFVFPSQCCIPTFMHTLRAKPGNLQRKQSSCRNRGAFVRELLSDFAPLFLCFYGLFQITVICCAVGRRMKQAVWLDWPLQCVCVVQVIAVMSCCIFWNQTLCFINWSTNFSACSITLSP